MATRVLADALLGSPYLLDMGQELLGRGPHASRMVSGGLR